MDKGSFIKEVDLRLGADFPSLGENSTYAVLTVLQQRIQPDSADHIATHLPKDLREDLGPTFTEVVRTIFAASGVRKMNKHQFLEAVKDEAGFRNTDEAFLATKAVFGALKAVLPAKDVRDTANELPADLREIWQLAA